MGRLRTVGIVAGGLVGTVVFAAVAGWVWLGMTAQGVMDARYEAHAVDFPIPFPLGEAELNELRAQKFAEIAPAAPGTATDAATAGLPDPLAGLDLEAIARERAIGRGQHLVEARYACGECHGHDFGGGTMVDDPMIGTILGPNLTTGAGSVTLDYGPADWDRIVRHGVKPDGRAAPMPAKDFFAMSDRELSDIISYIRSLPPVDEKVPAWTQGPLGTVLIATGQFEFSATVHPDHLAAHVVEPPAEAADATFGAHLAQACSGCHRANFAGGPVVGGPPDWPPAGNLTALQGWTYEDFVVALRQAKRPDGTALRSPMAEMPAMAAKMTDVELRAMWAFFQTLPQTPNGG